MTDDDHDSDHATGPADRSTTDPEVDPTDAGRDPTEGDPADAGDDPDAIPTAGESGGGTPTEEGTAGREADPSSGTARDAQSDGTTYDGARKIRERLLWVALAVLSLLALVALFQFYVSASAAINQWVADEYRQVMQAVFNLVVLLASGIGIALAVRELGEARESRTDA